MEGPDSRYAAFVNQRLQATEPKRIQITIYNRLPE